MKKKIISEQIFYIGRNISKYTETNSFTWGEVKGALKDSNIELQDTDYLEIGYREAEDSHEDAHSDAHYYVELTRYREETDEELAEREEKLKRIMDLRSKILESEEKKQYERLKAKYG